MRRYSLTLCITILDFLINQAFVNLKVGFIVVIPTFLHSFSTHSYFILTLYDKVWTPI